jgi:GAF domain-containing protein
MNSREEALETIKHLSSTLSLADLSRVVLAVVRDQVDADRGALFVVDHVKGEVRSIVADRVVGDITLPIGFGIAGAVAQTGQVIDTYNPQYDQHYDAKYEALLNYDTKDIYCMPVIGSDGTIVGVLELLNRKRPFTPEDHDFLTQLSRHLGPVLKSSSGL